MKADTSKRTWRGRSSALYPCTVLTLQHALEVGRVEGIVLAIKRDASGIALLVDRPALNPSAAWLRNAEKREATELHAHRPDRAASPLKIIDDLAGSLKRAR